MRQQLLDLANRIKEWRLDDSDHCEGHIEILCDAEDLLEAAAVVLQRIEDSTESDVSIRETLRREV